MQLRIGENSGKNTKFYKYEKTDKTIFRDKMQQQGSEAIEMSEPAEVLPDQVIPSNILITWRKISQIWRYLIIILSIITVHMKPGLNEQREFPHMG